MDIFCICRTCLNESDAELVSIYSYMVPSDDDPTTTSTSPNNHEIDKYRTQISNILDDLTGNKYVCISN